MSDDQQDPVVAKVAAKVAAEGNERDEQAGQAVDRSGESYPQIVWRQFRKNQFAYYSLWFFLALLLMAIFAPVLASNRPFIYRDTEGFIFPWFRQLFHPEDHADYIFNMALMGFFPWAIGAAFVNRWERSRGVIGFHRLWHISVAYFGLVTILCAIFAIPAKGGGYVIRPNNSYRTRNFVKEEYEARQANPDAPERWGIYPPIYFGPTEPDLEARNKPPGFRKAADLKQDLNDTNVHLLGTDGTGRDVLTRLIYGSRVSMSVGFVAVTIYITIGIIIGAIAGYFGGYVDMLLSRAIEVVLLFPAFFLILILVESSGGPNIMIVMFVIGITSWPSIARLIRGEVLKQRSIEYTTAARALGAKPLRVIFRHVLPNSLSPALVSIPFGISSAIIIEASMSLLGFGVRPPAASWGQFLNEAYYDYNNWWLIFVPSVAIFLTVTTFNLVGAGLRDAMDPRLRV